MCGESGFFKRLYVYDLANVLVSASLRRESGVLGHVLTATNCTLASYLLHLPRLFGLMILVTYALTTAFPAVPLNYCFSCPLLLFSILLLLPPASSSPPLSPNSTISIPNYHQLPS